MNTVFALIGLIITDSQAGHSPNSGAHCGQDQASHDVMAEFSKWLEAGEESIFSLETETNLSSASYELPEAAARAKKKSRK